MKKYIFLAISLLLSFNAFSNDLAEYRFTLMVDQKPVSIQDVGFGATATNKANVVKTIMLKKNTGAVVFNQTTSPAFASNYYPNGEIIKEERIVATASDNISKCKFDNLSWAYKYMEAGMAYVDGKDVLVIDGTFRSEHIYEDCRQYLITNREQQDHTYSQEEEKVYKKIYMNPNEFYVYEFSNQRIKTQLLIERIK